MTLQFTNNQNKEANIYNISFDPIIDKVTTSRDERVYVSSYQNSLSSAFVAAAQLQANLASNAQEADVILWGSLEDIKKCDNSESLSFRNKEFYVEQGDGERKLADRSDLPEMTSIALEEITTEKEIIDFDGDVIKGFELHQVQISYLDGSQEKQTKLTICENKSLRNLCNHSHKKNFISDDQKKKIDSLIDMIDPESSKYVANVGLVNDIKKFTILFFEQSLFKGGSFYLDIDMAERLSEFDSANYTSASDSNSKLPVFFNAEVREVDCVLLRDEHTNKAGLLDILKEYYDEITVNYKGSLSNSNTADKLFRKVLGYRRKLKIEHKKDLFIGVKKGHQIRSWVSKLNDSTAPTAELCSDDNSSKSSGQGDHDSYLDCDSFTTDCDQSIASWVGRASQETEYKIPSDISFGRI